MLIHLIAAARPNFMKIAPLYHALKKEPRAESVIVHTGQHYDLNMSDAFFQDLKLPDPHIHLGIGSGSHAEQTGKVMMAYEKIIMESRPDLVVVVGDVNSTLACTLAASKISYGDKRLKIAVPQVERSSIGAILKQSGTQGRPRPLIAHLEAGLRSSDRTMPEEINRIVTDALSDVLWTPSPDADKNLLREGMAPEKIDRVGNIMIDSLEMLRDSIERQTTCKDLDLVPGQYGVVTLHRPSNVDDYAVLSGLCAKLIRVSRDLPIVFPVHPRTRNRLEKGGLMKRFKGTNGVYLTDPLSYIPFMNLVFNCRMVITDSGGLQEETTYLGIPCLTMRPNTERPITVTEGTNQLCSIEDLESKVEASLAVKCIKNQTPEYWDGHTATRVVKSILAFL